MKKLFAFILLFLLPFIWGCQNKRELNELAIVLGTGVDAGENGEFLLTMQLVKPGEMGGGGGEAGGGGKSGGNAYLTESRKGATIFDIIRDLSTINSKRLFFSHNQVLVFGEELVKKGISPVVDFFERDTELRGEVPVLIARDKAQKILNLSPALEKIPAMEIKGAIDLTNVTGKSTPYHLADLAIDLQQSDFFTVPQIEIIEVNGQKRFRIAGMAVLEKGKLIGWLNPLETRGMLWTKGKVKSGVIVVRQEDMKLSLEIKKATGKITVEMTQGKPQFKMEIEEEGIIDEIQGPFDMITEQVQKINTKQADAIKEEINAALKKSQDQLKADVFGLGEVLHRKDPQYWGKVKDKWKDEYPHVDVQIIVKTVIRNSGEKTSSSVKEN